MQSDAAALLPEPGTIDVGCCMHPLNSDEQRTCESIVRGAPGCTIRPMPTHHIDQHGKLGGFAFSCPASSPISAVPLSRTMFFGHTACECEASSADIIRLLSNAEELRSRMHAFLLKTRERSKHTPVATFACRPENVEGYSREGGNIAGIRNKRTVDSMDWVPEVPDVVGVYHSFVRGHNRDTRAHKLFIIVSGGCGKAADEFYNCVLDCHGHATAKDCVMSEEAWWLRRASYRSRCRLIAECAAEFGIRVNHIRDIHAHDSATVSSSSVLDSGSTVSSSSVGRSGGGVRIAVPTIDTVAYDLCMGTSMCKDDTVQLFDSCANVENVRNGLLCSMHPSEGFWIFKGVQNRAIGANSYGISWDSGAAVRERNGEPSGMPTSVIRVYHNPRQQGTSKGAPASGISNVSNAKDRNDAIARSLQHAVVCTSDSPLVVRVNTVKQKKKGGGAGDDDEEIEPAVEKDKLYQFFDEQYLSLVARSIGWPRDKGVVELIPISVGMGVV